MCSGESDSVKLPFFPKYDTETLFKGDLQIIWFERDFCQSRYNIHNNPNGSNACTLIAVLLAAKCYKYSIQLNGPEKSLHANFIYGFAQSILEGNMTHENLKSKGILSNINLTVPEAIEFASKNSISVIEWKSVLYMEPLRDTLYENIKQNWIEWMHCIHSKHHKDIYIVLISDARSVLFIIHDRLDTVTLVDSHQHSLTTGAFVGVSKRQKLKLLCEWFAGVMERCFHSKPELYELSFLYCQKIKKKTN